MKIRGRIYLVLSLAVLVYACGNYKVHEGDFADQAPASETEVEHVLYFVGDAGEETPEQKRNFTLLREQVKQAQLPVTVVFLGDNIYPLGMPSKKDTAERLVAESIMRSQMEVVADLGAQVIFIPGNHDWKKGKDKGLKAIKRQEDFVKLAANDNIRLLPENGCPGPVVVELSDDCVLVLIDSQWWLQNWENDKDINEDCDVTSRFDFLSQFTEVIKDYKEQQVIVALHHPVMSSGSHAGTFSVKDHIFPLTQINPSLYIPLPVIGSIPPVYRATYGNVQDQPHPKYRELVQGLMFAADNHPELVFVSGHEHGLEYHRKDGHHFLVSGSGSRIDPLGKRPTTVWSHAEAGYMQLDVSVGGGVDLKIWEPDATGQAAKPVFVSNLVEPKVIESLPRAVVTEALPDSITEFISNSYAKGEFYQFLFGERYRDLYGLPIRVRNLTLINEHEGLIPLQKGGGFQTNSLRLEAPDGRQYVLRSLNKDATRLLPEIFQSTFANDILQDQFTASHPYAAVVIPPMADAVGVYHANPEVVYLPEQYSLGKYNSTFAKNLYLYEERSAGDWSGYPSFGGSNDIESYSKVLANLREDFENRVDQPFVLKSRLFDMVIADWDRHDDQWRWAEFDTRKGKLYQPIPRDRDQAFANYEGALLLLARATPTLRKMTKLTGDIDNIKWFNLNARWFDRDFMNQLTREQWDSTALALQAALTDEVIYNALKTWPPEVYEINGDEIYQILLERRDNLDKFATRYYEELTKRVFIKGTDNSDYFDVIREKGQTIVRVYDSNKEATVNELYYERVFFDSETESIEIYGLDGRDHFFVHGDTPSKIKVYLVGCDGKDDFIGKGKGARKGVKAFDSHKKKENVGLTYREVNDEFNTYDRKSFQYNYNLTSLRGGYNPDDGIILGAGLQFLKYGFKKQPFASKHRIFAYYALGSGAYGGGYIGEWKNVIGKAGIDLYAIYEAPSYVENYFGFGNDSEQVRDEIDYYRVRKRSFRVVPALTFGTEDFGNSFKFKLGLQSHLVDSTAARFVTEPGNGLPDDVFDDRLFLLSRAEYRFNSVDDPLITTRGFKFMAIAGVDYELDKKDLHRFFKTAFTLYYQFQGLGRPVLATRVGAEWHGGNYQFYQGARLGAHENLRGMHKHRFLGDRLFYQNIDLRFNLVKWRSYYLPAKMGIMASFDHGRVWYPEETSDSWHYAYGGGVWISPFQTLLLSLGYHVSDVDQRFELNLGFFF